MAWGLDAWVSTETPQRALCTHTIHGTTTSIVSQLDAAG